MKTQTLLFLAVIVIGMLLFLQFSDFRENSTARYEREKDMILVIKQQDVKKITLRNGVETIVFEAEGDGNWQMVSPVNYPADSNQITEIFNKLEFEKRQNTMKNVTEEDLETFGLKNPLVGVELVTKEGRVMSLDLGRVTAASNDKIFATAKNVFGTSHIAVSKSFEEALTIKRDNWRSPLIFKFGNRELKEVSFKSNDLQTVAVNNGVWKLRKPIKSLVDPDEMDAFLSGLKVIEVKDFLSQESSKDLAVLGLTTPSYEVSLKAKEGTQTSDQLLRIGNEVGDKPGQYFAQLEGREAVFRVTINLLDYLESMVNRVRDRRLISFEKQDSVMSFSLKTSQLQLDVSRDGEKSSDWKIAAPKFPKLPQDMQGDTQRISTFIQKLLNAKVVEFLPRSQKNEAALGLTKPAVVFNTTALAKEVQDRTADSAAKESESRSVQKVSFAFSSFKGGKLYVSKDVDGTPTAFIYEVHEDLMNNLPVKPWTWYEQSFRSFQKGELSHIQWKEGVNTFLITKAKGAPWRSTSSETELSPEMLNRQTLMLSRLPVLRYTGLANSKNFSKPLLELEYGNKDRKKTLIVGKENKDGTALAKFADNDIAFVLSMHNFQTLKLKPVVRAAVDTAPILGPQPTAAPNQ